MIGFSDDEWEKVSVLLTRALAISLTARALFAPISLLCLLLPSLALNNGITSLAAPDPPPRNCPAQILIRAGGQIQANSILKRSGGGKFLGQVARLNKMQWTLVSLVRHQAYILI